MDTVLLGVGFSLLIGFGFYNFIVGLSWKKLAIYFVISLCEGVFGGLFGYFSSSSGFALLFGGILILPFLVILVIVADSLFFHFADHLVWFGVVAGILKVLFFIISCLVSFFAMNATITGSIACVILILSLAPLSFSLVRTKRLSEAF